MLLLNGALISFDPFFMGVRIHPHAHIAFDQIAVTLPSLFLLILLVWFFLAVGILEM